MGRGVNVKITKRIMSVVFLLAVFGISAGSLLLPDKEFSENENRYLAEIPQLSVDNILNAKFQNGLEEYLKDQLCFRDEWISLKTVFQRAMGKTDIGGAYLGKDGYAFEKITKEDIDEELLQKNISYVEDYFAYCSDNIDASHLNFLLVPTSGLVLSDKLPEHAPLFDQNRYIEEVKAAMKAYTFIDVRESLLEHNEEEIYYRTDHHWTSDGAFVAYGQWCKSQGLPTPKIEDYKVEMVTDSFRGTLYSKILNADSAYDSIKKYEKTERPGQFHVVADGKELEGLYDYGKLEEKDKYLFFFGGNYGEVVITNSNPKETGKNLLIIKDSYANTFVPFIADDYDHVYMIDLRYSRADLRAYLAEHEITDVLVLYNISNFATDKNIFKLRGRG